MLNNRTLRARAARLTFAGLVATTVAPVAGAADDGGGAVGYYRQPAIWGDRIVFVSEDDLWTVDLAGAAPTASPAEPADASVASTANGPLLAWRLTSSEGAESHPVFSADGKWLAFAGQYDGNTDVYIMPVTGGPPTRLTFHPGDDEPLAWTADGGSVLFRSSRTQHFGRHELWRISRLGGMPQRYPFGECAQIALSAGGRAFAFTRWSNENWHWHGYRGGTAPEIWTGSFDADAFRQLTDHDANDLFPMWLLGRVYFLSDRSGAPNLWSDDSRGGDLKQHTHFAPAAADPAAIDGYRVRWPSAEPRRRGTRIVFIQGGALAVFDAMSETVQRLDVRLASDRVETRQRFAPLMDTLTRFAVSPDGEDLLVVSRGEIARVDVDTGITKQLTRTAGAREWGAAWLGGDRIALVTDADEEQQIAIAPADGSQPPSLATFDREAWLSPPVTSPDGTWIAFADKTLRLHVLNMNTLVRTQADQADGGEITDYRFSPDSRWLAYAMPRTSGLSTVHLYNVRTQRSFAVSDGLSNDRLPRWDPAGRYLYFVSDRHVNPAMAGPDFEFVLPKSSVVVAVPLASDVPPPVKRVADAAGVDLEAWAKPPEESEDRSADDAEPRTNGEGDDAALAPGLVRPRADNDADDTDGADDDDDDAAPRPVRIDTDGLAARQYVLPIDPANIIGLEAGWGSVLYLTEPTRGLLDEDWPPRYRLGEGRGTLRRYDFLKEESDALAERVASFDLSADGRTVAVPVKDGFKVLSATASDGGEAKIVTLDEAQLRIDIPAEWRQMLHEAWRLQRDFYWAPTMAGVNWPAMKDKYAALLPRVGTRRELNDLIGEMIGELQTSHTYIWGGEQRDEPETVSVGMLGADFAFENGAYRIRRVIEAPAWAGVDGSPLAMPHLNLAAGDLLLGVNGIPLGVQNNIHDVLQGQAGRRLTLTVAPADAPNNRRNVEVDALESDAKLRYLAWVEARRRYVDEQSDGALGYVHIPDMGSEGLAMFSRLYFPQVNKPGLIIDVRDNGGGFVSQMILSRLAREILAYDQPRHGRTWTYPANAPRGHLAVLINQHAGSDGDIFPAMFKRLGLGPLIGTRTWGGVVGIRGDKPFVDFGVVTRPEFAWWEPAGGWTIENRGVEPDIEVDLTPSDRLADRDPQLDRAIAHLLDELEREPRPAPAPPAYPR